MAPAPAAAALDALRERVVRADAQRSPLRLRGSGSKDFYGEALAGEVLDTRPLAGIVAYEPSELVITALCGTPLRAIESALAERGQFLAFEPPAFGADATIGGVVAAGLSGPRRAYAGAARDFVLGASLLTAAGELLHFGGQVMKNVAGFDLARLLCGSLGFFGLITQVSLKVLPRARAEATLLFECDAAGALERFTRWRPQPLPISASAWHDGIAYVRLSGSPSAVRSARAGLGGEALDERAAQALWVAVRDQTHGVFREGRRALWRLAVPATTPLSVCPATLIEWSGALRWLRSDEAPAALRERIGACGGAATLWRGARTTTMFQPLAAANLALHRRLKEQFDPNGIFNPGRLIAGL